MVGVAPRIERALRIIALVAMAPPGCTDDAAPTNADGPGTSSGSESSSSEGSTGGDSPAPQTGTHESGTRLRARVLDGGDGATIFVSWWDSELDVACEFAEAEDGSTRCLPQVGNIAFLDDRCSQPVVVLPQDDPLPAYVVQDLSTCLYDAARVVVHVPTGQLDVTSYYHANFDGTCHALQVGASERVYALDPVPITEFVRADVVTETRGDRLDLDIRVGEDGSRQLGQIVDRSLAETCEVRLAAGRCLPTALAGVGSSYANAACTEEVALYCEGPGCAAPRYAAASSTSCGQAGEHSFWTLGTTVVTSVWSSASGTCERADTYGAACPFVELGASVELGSFAETGSATLGNGRLRAPLVTATDGSVLDAFSLDDGHANFWDEEVSSYCSVLELPSGELVCVSGAAHGLDEADWVAYADSECSQGLVDSTSCEAPRYVFADDDPGDHASRGGFHLYAIDGLHAGDAAYVPTDAGCEARSFTGELWVVGDELVPSEVFPSVMDRIE